jgi:hypothetical protein
MSIQSRAYLESKFKTGDKPTQADFYDWLDSFFHLNEDSFLLDDFVTSFELSSSLALYVPKIDIVDNLLSTSTTQPLSANQGRILNDLITSSSTSSLWGNITGTLSNQTDLQSELDAKSIIGHTHTESEITDFGSYAPLVHTHVASDITNFNSSVNTLIASSSIGDLLNVDETGKNTGDALTWNGVKWTPSSNLGVTTWGDITGTLSNQTDLQNELDALDIWTKSGNDIYYNIGNVGIGTASPGYKLHVNSTGTNDNTIFESTDAYVLLHLRDNTTTSTEFVRRLGDVTQFSSGGVQALTIDATGKVGIGTDAPSSLLHLKSTGDVLAILEADSDNAGDENNNPRIEFRQDGGLIVAGIGQVGDTGQIYTGSLANALYLINDSSDPVQIGSNNQADLTIDSSGNVGIGTTSPAYKLRVDGTIQFNGNTSDSVDMSTSAIINANYLAVTNNGFVGI